MHHSAQTRSSIRRTHALITPESQVPSTLPGWDDTTIVLLVSPELGARFVQYIAYMTGGAAAAPPPATAGRFLYVMAGAVRVSPEGTAGQTLTEGGFVYLPPGQAVTLQSQADSQLLVFEKPYRPLAGGAPPEIVWGDEATVQATPFQGDPDAMLKRLLPVDQALDFEVNLFAFQPGASLPLVEVHQMEHGMLLLAGHGIYRLDDDWYPVQEGDVIWMGPFCPQWFAALGKSPARYIYYKDVNRHPLG